MTGIKDLKNLLKSMKPELAKGEFVFCTIPDEPTQELKKAAVMLFKEKEGITSIIDRNIADSYSFFYDKVFRMITLGVHSDLSAVGFLAAVTEKLAENRIPVNAVSAYYHDHLFVPSDMAEKTMNVLKELSKS